MAYFPLRFRHTGLILHRCEEEESSIECPDGGGSGN